MASVNISHWNISMMDEGRGIATWGWESGEQWKSVWKVWWGSRSVCRSHESKRWSWNLRFCLWNPKQINYIKSVKLGNWILVFFIFPQWFWRGYTEIRRRVSQIPSLPLLICVWGRDSSRYCERAAWSCHWLEERILTACSLNIIGTNGHCCNNVSGHYCQAQPKPKPKLGAEIALISKLSWNHPPTHPPPTHPG